MLIESTQAIFKACPILFRGRELPLSQNLMALGFGCSDGWADVLMKYASKLEAHLQARLDAGESLESLPMAVHVKEDKGTLRMFLSSYDDVCDVVVRELAFHSECLCEICGSAGKFVAESKRTLCRRHATAGRRGRH